MAVLKQIVISGGFDDLKSRDLRFLEEASKLGELTVLLWSDSLLEKINGHPPKFPLAERNYFLNAVRYVSKVAGAGDDFGSLPKNFRADVWADVESPANNAREIFCRENKIPYRIFSADDLKGFPEPPLSPSSFTT